MFRSDEPHWLKREMCAPRWYWVVLTIFVVTLGIEAVFR